MEITCTPLESVELRVAMTQHVRDGYKKRNASYRRDKQSRDTLRRGIDALRAMRNAKFNYEVKP